MPSGFRLTPGIDDDVIDTCLCGTTVEVTEHHGCPATRVSARETQECRHNRAISIPFVSHTHSHNFER